MAKTVRTHNTQTAKKTAKIKPTTTSGNSIPPHDVAPLSVGEVGVWAVAQRVGEVAGS